MKTNLCWGVVLVIGVAFAVVPVLAADQSGLAERAAMWEKDYNSGDLAGIVAMYADDGCRMAPNMPTAHGHDEIMANLKASKDHGVASVKVTVTAAESSGNLGVGAGTYSTSSADGKETDHGKWMLYSKKSGGTWKTVCDIYNSDMPMPGMSTQ